MRIVIVLILSVFFGVNDVISQSQNAILREGNKYYEEGDYHAAELNYRRVLEQNPQNTKALYNLSNALYRQGRYDEASNILEALANMNVSKQEKADIFHNLGNAKIGEQQIKEGIEAYKNSLRIRPDDMDTKHNLSYAMRLLQEQEQQQQDQNQDEDEQDQDSEQDDQPQDSPEDQQPEDEQQEQQPHPDQISPQDAERILDALNQQEQKVQENIDREEKQRVPVGVEKEW